MSPTYQPFHRSNCRPYPWANGAKPKTIHAPNGLIPLWLLLAGIKSKVLASVERLAVRGASSRVEGATRISMQTGI